MNKLEDTYSGIVNPALSMNMSYGKACSQEEAQEEKGGPSKKQGTNQGTNQENGIYI